MAYPNLRWNFRYLIILQFREHGEIFSKRLALESISNLLLREMAFGCVRLFKFYLFYRHQLPIHVRMADRVLMSVKTTHAIVCRDSPGDTVKQVRTSLSFNANFNFVIIDCI